MRRRPRPPFRECSPRLIPTRRTSPYNEFKKLKEDQDSRFYGIGVTIVQHRDGVYISSAVEGTPAGRLGLRYGDRIVEVDGKSARDWTSEQVSKKVRGGRGEAVTIKVERAGALQYSLWEGNGIADKA